jgi:glycosyltransferase involved in cell wall biosynthesis
MFTFLRYVRPTWYFNLAKDIIASLLVEANTGSVGIYPLVNTLSVYNERQSAEMDIAYQLLMKGFIPNSNTEKSQIDFKEITNIDDNYVFAKRYFGNLRCLYILIIRLLSLKNPLSEFKGYIKSIRVQGVNLYGDVRSNEDFETFDSMLLKENPHLSIVIPTLNRYEYLKDVLSDLEKQDYKNFEVVIVDQSDSVSNEFYSSWNLDIQLVRQEEKALWLARNSSIKIARSDYLFLTEDDVRLPVDWIRNHLKCLDFFKADISAGIFFPEGSKPSINQSMFKIADHLATGNVCIRRDVFRSIGLFDRQFEKQRMGDGEFGLRAYLAGFKSISNPLAYCIDVKAPTGGLREMGSWDSLRPTKLLAPRPIPSVLYFLRNYFDEENAILYIVLSVPFSFVPYRFKNSKKTKLAFLFISPVLFPLMVFVSTRSWIRSSRMLKEGPRIDKLK